MSSITTKPPTTVTSKTNVPTVKTRGRMNLTVAHYYEYGYNNSMCIAPMSASLSAEKDLMAGGSSCHTIDPSTFPRRVPTEPAQPQHWHNCNPGTNNMKIPSASDHHRHHPSLHLAPGAVQLPATSKLSNSAEHHSCSSPPRSVTIEAPNSSCGIKINNPDEPSSTFATSSKTTSCTVLMHEQGIDIKKGDISNRSRSTPSPNSTSMPINRNNTTRILSSPQSVAITGTENAHKIASAAVATIINNSNINSNINNNKIATHMATAANENTKNVTGNMHTNSVSLLEKLPPPVSSSDPKGFQRARRTVYISSPPVTKVALPKVQASSAASLAMGQKAKPQDQHQQPRPVTAPEPAPASAPTSSAPAPVSSKVSSSNVTCRVSTRPNSNPQIQRLGLGVKQDLQYNMAYMPQKVKMEKVYDMNLVPKVKKNRAFLEKWRRLAAWEQQSLQHELGLKHNNQELTFGPSLSLPTLVPCDASVDADVSDQDQDQEHISSSASSSSSATHTSECSMVHHHHHHHGNMNIPCHLCLHPSDLCPDEKNFTSTSSAINNAQNININNNMMPFAPDCDSAIWVPRSRQDWEDSIDEMVAICAAAEWHRATDMQNINKSAGRGRGRKKQKQMQQQQLSHNPPISRIYIRDRIEIDDPLRGYQIRHKTGGWMQGFVMMTNFTTWTHYFKWDSLHAVNGIDHDKGMGMGKGRMDDDGTLSTELEGQVRSGDALAEGVVWSTIAEMSLVGALGCGEYLLQMALDDISRRGTYDYVVLEATEAARPFYEKFGFIRVGAVCKYGNEKDVISESGEVQVVGYRHWTYANESEKRLDGHGGPSCMMARRVRRRTSNSQSFGSLCEDCGHRTRPLPSFVDELSSYFVSEKPKIKSLGRMNNTANSNNGTTAGRGRPRKRPMSASGSETEKVAKKSKLSSSQSQPKQKKATTLSGRRTRAPSRLEEEQQQPKKCKQSTARTTIEHKTKCIGRTSMNSSAPPISTNVVNAVTDAPTSGGKDKKSISLRKQRIPTMYRSPKKLYYYNKIVTLKKGEENSKLFQIKSKYYFVINYDAPSLTLQLIPLLLRGSFKGKREGRPKWKADVLPRDKDQDEESYLKSMHVITSACEKWDIVQSHAVTKCASVKQESWDIVG